MVIATQLTSRIVCSDGPSDRHRQNGECGAVRQIRYQEIADELRRRVASARRRGSVLPSESELSAEFAASRVTVRRALELVRDEGLIAARQGFGWFVATEPVRQRLERLLTIESQLESSGTRCRAAGDRFRVRDAAGPRRATCSASTVCCASSASTSPTASRSRSSRCGAPPSSASSCRWPTSSASRSTSCSTSSCGARRRRSAPTLAEPPDAELLAVPVGSPLLNCRRVTTDTTGRPVLMSEHLFPAHRTEFVVDLPLAGRRSPTGLRLVD